MADLTIALAGNPNAGKSTIFNALTGLRQHTGNWPGKTVEIKEGTRSFNGRKIHVVDLPGTYSLSAYSPDEIVARDYLVDQHPDAVICVVDATNLERNLYLVVQLLELGVPVTVALNMSDQASSLGIDIDRGQLSRLLGDVPVVPTIASRRQGIDQLLAATIDHIEMTANMPATGAGGVNGGNCRCHCDTGNGFEVDYGLEIEMSIEQLANMIEFAPPAAIGAGSLALNGACPRWLALKLLEGEQDVVRWVSQVPGGEKVVKEASTVTVDLSGRLEDDVDIVTADHRYGTVSAISRQVVMTGHSRGHTLTERIDGLATHRLLGLPIFLAVMYLIFRLVIDVSAPYLDWIDGVINGPVAGGLSAALEIVGAAPWHHSLVIDGIVAGVGGVLTFVPGLIVLFLFLALLEDSGYMARAGFVLDRFMRFIGLHGKSVIPLMLGFGCAVPAIYATRTIANRRDRLLTALLIPFMSCSARLPVYVVFAMAFFGAKAGTVIWLLYVLGIVIAVLVGLLFSRTILKPAGHSAFVLELPPYRLPTLKGLALHTWENTREFIRNAGTVILLVSIILWFLLNLPWGVESQEASLYGRMSSAITPVLEPAGFGSYETSGALITGLIAKEMVVSTLAQVYTGAETGEAAAASATVAGSAVEAPGFIAQVGAIASGFGQATLDAGRTLLSIIPGVNLAGDNTVTEDTALSRALQQSFTPLAAVAFLVFVLLYIPCVATMGAIKQEFGGRWALSAALYQTFIAWLLAVIVFQGGTLLGVGG